MKRKTYLLRADPELLAALNRWAADELRSVNAQIEFVLRRALRQAGRYPPPNVESEKKEEGASPESRSPSP